MRGYLSEKFQKHRCSNFRDITETVTQIFAKEIGKLGLPVPGASLKIVHWTDPFEEIYLSIQLDLKDSKF